MNKKLFDKLPLDESNTNPGLEGQNQPVIRQLLVGEIVVLIEKSAITQDLTIYYLQPTATNPHLGVLHQTPRHLLQSKFPENRKLFDL